MRRNSDDGRWCSPRHESVTTKREEPSSSAKSCCCGLVSIIVVVCILCVALLAGLVALAGLYVNLYVDTRSCSQSDVGTTRATPDTSKQPLPVVEPSKPVSLSVPPDSFQYLSVSLNETSSVSFSIDNTGNDLVIAVYGRIGAEPTHVIYDVVATLVLEQSRKRSVDFKNKTVIFEDLSVGNWIFGVFNGDSETLQSDAVIDLTETNLKSTTEGTTTPSEAESNEPRSRVETEAKPTDSFVTTVQTSIHESSLGTTQVDQMQSTVAEVTTCTTTVIETSTVESTTSTGTLQSATTSNVVRSTASSTTKVADTSMAPQTACVCPSLPPRESTSQESGSSDTPAATTDITTTDSAVVASTPPTVTTGTTHVNTSSDGTTENPTLNTVTESASPDETTQPMANQTTEFITKEYNVTTEAQTTDVPIYAVSPNQSVPLSVPPDRFQYLQLKLNETSDVTFVIENYELDVRVVIYGRMKFKPTHFEYDDSRLIVERSSLVPHITVHFEKLSSGTWSFGILNGNNVTFKASSTAYIKASAKPCPLDCLGRGGCKDGICDCVEGWAGEDCSQVDPISCEEDDCGGHGTLREGVCHCSEGWTGDNCLQVDCIPSDCNGHGSCDEETCICDQGWKGIMCDEVDCIPSDCNMNGQCIDGVCLCDTDWQGDDCSIVYRPCLNDCSGHGDCDNITGICSCHDDWQKQDCSEVKCGDHDCSGLGVCHNGTCDCDAGWTGPACTERDCEYGCREHGSCQSGTCICNKGWSGTACELDVCPNNCSVNGDCLLVENSWQCVCQGDFKGADCAIAYESTCDDGIDNDQDTFIDCEDPDCCNDTVCESLASCSYSDSPEEYAQTNESATQHFYDQVSFLFEGSGIQQEVEEGYIQPSLISVLRGYVTNRDGTPLQGVTIAIQGFSQYGYTTTRKDGGFDMAVNGGGVLTATFSKMNFIGAQRSVQPTINQYFVLSKIVILLGIDPKVTKIDLDSDKIQIAEGSESEDAAGKRKGVIMFHPGTEATVVSYNGTDNQTLTKPSVRITEYTVGENGEEAMPAQLPPFTGYTYAMELSMDEAAVNGSTDVFFNQKLYYYVEDYLGFPVGSAVPTGFYNRSRGEWVPSENGLVIELVTPDDPDRASVDVTGTGTPATEEELIKLGFNDQELEALADLYTPGQKLWRVPIPHFTPWDCNWPYGPPTNSCVPAECNDLPEPFDDCNEGSTTPINQNAPTQNPDPPVESPAPTNGYNPNLPVQSPEIINEVTPKYPRIPSIPYVPGVPSIPGIPSDPGLPVLPSVPLPGREEQSPRHWFAVNPNIPDDVENPGDFGPPPGAVCNNASWDIDKDLGYWKPNGSIELRDLSKSPGTIHKPIPGTSLNLVYNHNRHAGYKSLMKIPVTGDNVPSIMQKVVVEVTIAGKTFTKELTPSPNLTESIVWDGKDTYGRAIKGSEKAKVKIGYKYGLQYYPVRSEFQQSFNRLSQADTRSTLARRDRAVTYWEDREMDVVRNLLNPGLGGWSFDIHHSYDAIAGTLHTGSGDVIGYRDKNKVLKTVAGSAVRAGIDCRTCGEGFGEDTELRLPVAVAASPDGSVFLGDYNFIRRIWPNGTVSTVTQLVDTRPKQRYYMAVNPRTGLLYISDSTRRQVLYIDPSTGEEKVFAGTGERCPPWENGCGDNGLAINAKLNTPKGIAFGKDGDVFIVDNRRVRQIGSDGIIEAYIGTNLVDQHEAEKSSDYYTAPMNDITLTWPTDIAVHPEDDTLYIVDGNVIFTLNKQGNVRPIIGRTPVRPPVYPPTGYPDREKALDARLVSPQGITVSPSGTVYISETDFKYIHRVRAHGRGSGVYPVAGQASSCACDDRGCNCFSEGASAVKSQMYAPAMVTLTPSNELYIAEQGNFRVRSMGAGHPKVGEADNYLIPGPDANDIFIFNGQGQHLRTFNMKTRRDVHKFEYNEDGLLQKVIDWKNNSVKVERLSDGTPHAIVSPKGVRTVLGVNAEGLMDFFSDPSDGITRVSYQDGGLIRGVNYPDGFSHYLAYDENGRVFAQYDNLGRRELYGNFQGSTSNTVTTYTSLNREQSVETQSSSSQIKKIYKTKAGKTHEVISKVQEGITETTFPDGTMTIESGAPHPVWGSQVSLPGTSITVLPSGLQKRIDNDHFATLAVPDDPLTLQTIGQHVKVNDQTISTTEYSYSDRASTLTVDGNIQERIIYDDMDRPVRIQRPSTGFVDTTLEYVDETSEEVKRIEQGEMWLDYSYDNQGNIISERTKSGLETRFEYIQNGKLSKLILPSGRTYQFLYDDAGNFFKIMMPSGAEHRMQTRIRTETRDELYKAPVSQQTVYLSTYNLDSDLIRTYNFVLGCVFHWYDDFDRLTAAAFDKHFIRFAYTDNSNNVVNVNRYYDKNIHSIIEYSYDGFLPTQQIVSDGSEVSATYVYEYNNVFLINQIRAIVYGRRYEMAMEYDDFGVMTKYGQFDLSDISPNTRRISDSKVECTYTHDQNGRITDIVCMINSNEVFSYRLSYNGESLVSGRAVKIAQDDYTNQYLYDNDGQLVDVSTDGQASEHYEYDINGNRVSWGGVGGREQHSALYDDNDRIQQFDSLLYKFTDDGFLLRKGSAIFTYNAKGELEKAIENGFYDKEYRYDGLGRLIESFDSSSGQGIRYFYGDPANAIRVTHVVHGEEELVTALYYNQLGQLFAMVTEDVISYVICDHLGTPMAVFDEQGSLIKMIIRDSYGVLLSDSAPGVFVPIAYVGGIFDAKTTLTRFHYRDYDASIGRWTSRDPSLYSSQQPNLYQYVFNDPINLRDPLGLFCIGGTFYNIIGGGAELCFDRNGWSACAEAGLGVGGTSFGIDSGAPKKGFTSEIFADVSVSVPGYSIGGRTALKFQPDKRPCVETTTFQEVQFGRGKLKQGSEGTYQAQMDLTSSRKQRKKTKFGVGAKAGVKACYGR